VTQHTRTITRQVVRAPAAALPAWLSAVPLHTWHIVPNSSLATYKHPSGEVCHEGILEYSGFHIKPGTSVAVFHGGGHTSSSDNSLIGIDLAADVPNLFTIVEPTPTPQRTVGAGEAIMWWGTPPNQKPNSPHSYDTGLFSVALNRHIWFGHPSPWPYGGGLSGPEDDRLFSVNAATGAWDQPGADLGALPVGGRGRGCTQDAAGNLYVNGNAGKIFKYTPGSGFGSTHFAYDPGMTNDGYDILCYDSLRNRIISVGDRATANKWWTISCATGATANVTSLLNGNNTVLANLDAAIVYTLPASLTYDSVNDCYSISRGNGPGYFNINPTTWAVTYMSPSTTSGTLPGSVYAEMDGRFKYVPALKGILCVPNTAFGGAGEKRMWFIRTAA
jgi:hypothetical protein